MGLLTPLGRHLSTVLSQLEHTANWWYLSPVCWHGSHCVCVVVEVRVPAPYTLYGGLCCAWAPVSALSLSDRPWLPLVSPAATLSCSCSDIQLQPGHVACRVLIWEKERQEMLHLSYTTVQSLGSVRNLILLFSKDALKDFSHVLGQKKNFMKNLMKLALITS